MRAAKMRGGIWIHSFCRVSIALGIVAILAACYHTRSDNPAVAAVAVAASPSPSGPEAIPAFVVLGENGARIARVFVKGNICPLINLADGHQLQMDLRAPSGTMPLRTTRFAVADSKPAEFPLSICEKPLPANVHHASINGQALPVKGTPYQRIVVIGDTGCRLLKSGSFYQTCNDPAQFPFAQIAKRAADWRPDLVVHVGDYHYRETRCPPGNASCAGSPWGYGYDAWREDFFKPAAALLRAAPWVMVRGNHETCNRAGQGWWRFLDPRPLLLGRDCNQPANDVHGNYSDPYAIPIDEVHDQGQGTQLIVADSSNTINRAIQPNDVRFGKYQDLYVKLTELASHAKYNIALFHQPILGFASNRRDPNQPFAENKGIQSVFQTLNPQFFPPTIQVLLSGHFHSWEQISFSTPHPTQFVVGSSGTQLDMPLPDPDILLALGVTPAPGAVVENISTWPSSSKFGYMTMEHAGPGQWNVKVWDQAGQPVKTCQIVGRRSVCQDAGEGEALLGYSSFF